MNPGLHISYDTAKSTEPERDGGTRPSGPAKAAYFWQCFRKAQAEGRVEVFLTERSHWDEFRGLVAEARRLEAEG